MYKKLFSFLLAFAVIGGFVGATASAYYIVEEKEDSTYFIFINIIIDIKFTLKHTKIYLSGICSSFSNFCGTSLLHILLNCNVIHLVDTKKAYCLYHIDSHMTRQSS